MTSARVLGYRWKGGAEALTLHIATSMVVAFEQLKEGPIMECFALWKAYYKWAIEEADFKPKLVPDEEYRERWEKTVMIEVIRSTKSRLQKHTLSCRPAGHFWHSGVRCQNPEPHASAR